MTYQRLSDSVRTVLGCQRWVNKIKIKKRPKICDGTLKYIGIKCTYDIYYLLYKYTCNVCRIKKKN